MGDLQQNGEASGWISKLEEIIMAGAWSSPLVYFKAQISNIRPTDWIKFRSSLSGSHDNWTHSAQCRESPIIMATFSAALILQRLLLKRAAHILTSTFPVLPFYRDIRQEGSKGKEWHRRQSTPRGVKKKLPRCCKSPINSQLLSCEVTSLLKCWPMR